jgi:hypothetical protein
MRNPDKAMEATLSKSLEATYPSALCHALQDCFRHFEYKTRFLGLFKLYNVQTTEAFKDVDNRTAKGTTTEDMQNTNYPGYQPPSSGT